MRLLVCGGRDYADQAALNNVLDGIHAAQAVTVLIEGGSKGADRFARMWAQARSIPVLTFSAGWREYGASAGPIRNARMLEQGRPDICVAFPGGKGTDDMVAKAAGAGIRVYAPFGTAAEIDAERLARFGVVLVQNMWNE